MLREIAERMSDSGLRVEVFTTHDLQATQPEQRRQWALDHDVALNSIGLPAEQNAGLFRRAIGALRFFIAALTAALRSQAEVVWVGSTPPVLMPLAMRIARRFRRFEIVYHCQDIHPESLEVNKTITNSVVVRLLRYVDKANVRAASKVITLSEDMKRTIQLRQPGVNNIAVINNFVFSEDDLGHSPLPTDRTTPTLIFAGTLGRFQNLPYLFDVLGGAASRCNFSVFVLGDGVLAQMLRDQVTERDYTNIHFLGRFPLGDALAAMDDADLGIVSLSPGVGRVAYPSKAIMYWSRGLPALALIDEGTALADELAANGLGVSLPNDDKEAAIEKLVQIIERWGDQPMDPKSISGYAKSEFSAKHVVSQYIDVVNRLEVK